MRSVSAAVTIVASPVMSTCLPQLYVPESPQAVSLITSYTEMITEAMYAMRAKGKRVMRISLRRNCSHVSYRCCALLIAPLLLNGCLPWHSDVRALRMLV